MLDLYKTCCHQSLEFLDKAARRKVNPFENKNCEFYESDKCRSDFFCRQLIKKVVIGSWFSNVKQAKAWMRPGMACYAKPMDTGGIVITTDPIPFLGDWTINQKEGLFFITKKYVYCSNCAKERALKQISVCNTCLPLFPKLLAQVQTG